MGCQNLANEQASESGDGVKYQLDEQKSESSAVLDAPKKVVNPCPECGQKREFRGEFVYFADAAILRECGSQAALPVGVNPKMQLAYELHRSAPEAPLYFVAKGQVELMPSMEEGLTQRQLVVDGDNWYFDAYAHCE